MTNLRVSTNANGTLILHMPAGEFKWKGGGWSVSRGIGRPTLNALANYCQQRQFKMSKMEIMKSLTNPTVLGTLFFGWDQTKHGAGQTKNDFREGQRVKHIDMGMGTVQRKLQKNVLVRFDNTNRQYRCNPENLDVI